MLAFALVTSVVAIAGCSSGSGTAAPPTPDPSGVSASAQSHSTSTPALGATPAPDPGGDSGESGAGGERDTRELAEACITASSQLSADFDAFRAAIEIHWDDARSALRPDSAYYVVVPYTDPASTVATEFQCELTNDLTGALGAGTRVTPTPDDFDLWATGREVRDGL